MGGLWSSDGKWSLYTDCSAEKEIGTTEYTGQGGNGGGIWNVTEADGTVTLELNNFDYSTR